jgi:signal transduction histidine kinase
LKILRRYNDFWNVTAVPALSRRIGMLLPGGKAVRADMRSNGSTWTSLLYGFFLALSLAAIVSVFIVGVLESRDRMVAQSKIQLRQKTALLEAYVSKILEANDMVIKDIASEIEPMSWPEIIASEGVWKLLATEKQFLKHSGVIALVSPEGSLVSYSEGFPANPFSVTDRDYFRVHRDHPSDATFIGEPIVGRVYGKPSLTMSKALRRQDGGFDGLILITMPIDYFLELFNGAASPTDVAQFLREDGKVVVNVPYREGSAVMPEWFAKAVEENAKAGVVSYRSMPEGVDRLMAYRKVGEFPFYVTYGVDERILLTGWRQSVRVYGGVLAIALAACTAAAFLARRRSIALTHSNESLREVSERLLLSQDEQRRSIARDLHDSTGQHLVGAAMELENVKSRMPDLDAETSLSLKRTADLISRSNEELRTLSYLLHPPMLDESGLPNALELLVVGFEERSGFEIELRVDPDLGTKRPRADVELAIFRIVQEALTNIYRHSRARKAMIRLVRQGHEPHSTLALTVRDDGVGIERRRRRSVGVGLSGMEARLRPLDGTLDISTGKTGTTISVKVRG